MVIHPEVIVTPDCPTIKFRHPREQVDLAKELPKILQAQGWACGTFFNVQFVSHDKNKLLACARFVVTEEVEVLLTSDDQYRPVTRTVFNRKVAQIDEWWEAKQDNKSEQPSSIDSPLATPMSVAWNPGKKVHQIKLGETVIHETKDKTEAQDIAEGRKPIPQAA